MWRIVVYFLLAFSFFPLLSLDTIWARRIVLAPEDKVLLEKANNVFIETIALTEKGQVNANQIQKIVAKQLEAIGLTPVHSKEKPWDVTLKVKCEERKSWVTLSKGGGDADQPGTPSRLWKGPACQLTYFVDEQLGPWRREIRTKFEDPWKDAQVNGVKNSGKHALNRLGEALQASNYPLELLAEWKQADRLAKMLNSSNTPIATKLNIIDASKQVSSPIILQALKKTMTIPALATHATLALGHMGKPATSTLLNILNTSELAAMKTAAAQALGEIGSHNAGSEILTHLLAIMESQNIPLEVLTEIVKAVGKIPDHRSVEPLEKLALKAWTSPSNTPHIHALRNAIENSIWQLNPGAGGYE